MVYPEKQLAKWTAIKCTADHILDYIELDGEHSIFEVAVPAGWIGMSIGRIDIRRRYNINILGVKSDGKINVIVKPDMILDKDKTLLVLGEYRDLQKCFPI